MYGRRLTITTATIALAGGIAMPAAAAVKAPPGTKAVTPTGIGTQYDRLQLLGGSDTELLYLSKAGWAGDLASDPNDDYDSATPVLNVRDRNGTVHVLGDAPNDVRWSTEGNLVTGLRHDTAHGYVGLVDVWTFGSSTVTHRTVNVPTSVTSIGTTPTGFVFADGGTLRSWDAASATQTTLGVPFPGQTIDSLVTAGSSLVVTGNATGVAVMSYAQPGTFTPLNTGGIGVYCSALDAQGAACSHAASLMFVPLDGSAPTVTNNDGGYYIALSGTHVLFTSDSSDETRLFGFSAGSPTVTYNEYVDFVVVSAYGRALFLPVDDFADPRVLQATSVSSISSAFALPHSPETAAAFSLTGQRVAYVSDLQDSARPQQPFRVRSVGVRAGTARVSLAAPRDIGHGSGSAHTYPAVIAAAGDTTAYIVETLKQQRLVSAHVVVHTAHGTVQLQPRPDLGTLQAAGNWVGYTAGSGIELYNLRSGHSHKVLKGQRPSSWALTPTRLVYGDDRDVAVKSIDLATGNTMTIYRHPGGKFPQVNVVADGNHVGWNVARNTYSQVFGMRTLPGGPVVHLPYSPYAMTATGVLMKSVDQSNPELTDTWFQPFGGSAHALMSGRIFDELPQLADHALAWVSVDGNLKVAPYRY